jgi:hypothetical protein
MKENEMYWASSTYGGIRNAYNDLVEKPEGKRPNGRSRRRWKIMLKMVPKEIGYKEVRWIHLTQDTVQWRVLVDTVMNLQAA